MHPDLVALAAAHGVATRYENADQREVVVDEDVVVAVLAQLDVAAGTPADVTRELAAVRSARSGGLPPTVVLREGTAHPIPGPGTLTLEDGTEQGVTGELPADLPLGWHRLATSGQRVVVIVVPDRLPEVDPAWGWMIQLYALRSAGSWGIGDYGDLAAMASRSAAELGAGVLLVNPVQAVSPTCPVERSPYSPASRRFLNPLYLRVPATEAFAEADDTTKAAVLACRPPNDTDLIDYDAVWDAKRRALELLWAAYPQARALAEADLAADPALRDFAGYCALAETHGPDWREWPADIRDAADPPADHDRVAFHAWLQGLCATQLRGVWQQASGMGVALIHDLPVGVRPGGADTWTLRDVFAPNVTVGAPPDAFSQLGQDWNLPPWRPDRLAQLGYAPFRDLLRGIFRHAHGVRVDHVAGLWRLWWIPPGEPASRGTYVHYDAEAMLGILALEAHRAGAVVVGEDLGTVRPEVTTTLHERGMLSSAVLWFQRDWDTPGHPFVPPKAWNPHAMASITTHDLPTVAGWLSGEHVRVRAELSMLDGPVADEERSAAADRAALFDLLRAEGVPTDDPVIALHTVLARAAARLLLTSPADVVGEHRQPNLPGTVDQYPNWRIPLPVTLDAFFADDRVRRAVAALRAARPTVGDLGHGAR
ncbi:MAG TPA: 4-alpha-glucanotransferase [Pseudonocardiaceae bacterium]